MFFWNSLAFSMMQGMLAIWSVVPLPFLKPAWKFIPRYLIFFVAMVNGIDFLISLYDFSLLVYRNASDFCVLILYPATLLNSLISSSHFLILSLGYSMYTVSCHLQRVRALLLLFQSGFLLFLFLLWFLWLGLPKLCLNSSHFQNYMFK